MLQAAAQLPLPEVDLGGKNSLPLPWFHPSLELYLSLAGFPCYIRFHSFLFYHSTDDKRWAGRQTEHNLFPTFCQVVKNKKGQENQYFRFVESKPAIWIYQSSFQSDFHCASAGDWICVPDNIRRSSLHLMRLWKDMRETTFSAELQDHGFILSILKEIPLAPLLFME